MAKPGKTSTPILDVIDGHNWINRAYYAAPKLTTVDGRDTGAVKAFINMVNKLIKKRMDTRGECYLVVAFDNKTRDTFRSKMMAKFLDDNMDNIDLLPEKFVKGYKGTRSIDDVKVNELVPQFALAQEALHARGIKTYRIKGFEADDVIGTLAHHCKCNVMIWSRDKDFAQLLRKDIRVTQQSQGNSPEIKLTRTNCIDVYGIPPKYVIDYLALCGDGADNIPGIPGVGSKTALTLIGEHGPYTKIIKAPVKGKLGEKLKHPFYLKVLKLSYDLATICVDVPDIDLDYNVYRLKDVSKYTKKMDAFANSIEFTKLFTS